MKTLLIRADDLGFSEGINYGIAKSVKDGIIKTVGVMTNMPAALHGIELLKGENVCYGQHTNICVGRPLTDPKLIPSLVNENGEFKSSQDYRNAKTDFVVLDEVILEIEAQYYRFTELTGEQPRYFEGHAVFSENFFKGLKIVAEKHNLKYFDMPFDDKAVMFGNAQLYVYMESMKSEYDPFVALKKALMQNLHEEGVVVFVCHPGYLDAYVLEKSSLTLPRPMEVKMVCSIETKKWISENEIRLVTYDDL